MIITGGGGYIAALVNYYSKYYDIELIDKDELDLSDVVLVNDYFKSRNFDIVLHAGAMPKTEDCENNPQLTYKVNVLSTKAIADVCKLKNKRMIFISSEQVFNGKNKEGPFNEEEEAISVSVYGNHKIECEQYISSASIDYLILRFSWMFGLPYPGITPSYNLMTQVLKCLFLNEETHFAVNELRGVTYAHKFARQFDKISKLPCGTYNITASNDLNTFEIAKKIGRLLNFETSHIEKYIKPNYEKYNDNPRDFHMSNEKIERNGVHFGCLEDNLVECLVEFGWLKEG